MSRDSPESFAASWRALADNDAVGELHTLRAPTTVLHATEDVTGPIETRKDMVARIPGARLVVVPGPHMVQLEGAGGFRRGRPGSPGLGAEMMVPVVAGPLNGITVLEVGAGVACAVAGMILADFGADVSRSGTAPDGAAGDPGFAMWHRNKRLVVPPSGGESRTELMDRLSSSIDVCIVGSGCPEIEANVATLAARHPRAVFLVMPPYCGEAPWDGQAESSELIAAVMGLAMRQSSNEDGPVDSVYPHVAYVHGMWAATCAAAALLEREASGLGQVVTVSGTHAALVTGTATFVIDPEAVESTKPVGAGGPHTEYDLGGQV